MKLGPQLTNKELTNTQLTTTELTKRRKQVSSITIALSMIAMLSLLPALAMSYEGLGQPDELPKPPTARTAQSFVSEDCVACHKEQTQHWQQSDHAKAMNPPNTSTVKGNFKDQHAEHFEQQAFFFMEDKQYKATIKDSKDDQGETFTVKYTFGHDPLQQYLVATERGKLQVLPFAWDARSQADGGQRWYHLYTHEVSKQDRLHWRQPLQNWNGMCADCHSDELTRNYDASIDNFDTQFSGINVGCVSCHGSDPKYWGKNHPLPGQNPSSSIANKELVEAYAAQTKDGYWKLESGKTTVSWSGAPRDNAFMDDCFACHALRAPLSDGFSANTEFLDNFSPQLITPPNYFADGQIKEEVYVYGSFLQSKMYQKGVNCLDCHDPHTMKLKIEGNGLCLQCHTAQTFDSETHHGHPMNTEGAQCVNCHMPDEIYMGIDARRDHSFKIPRPDLSKQFDTPNACASCHNDESNQWAAQAIEEWHGKPDNLSNNRHNLLKLRHGQRINLQDHLLIAYDQSIDEITRASVIEMLNQTTGQLLASHLKAFVASKDDLVRLAAARVGNLVDVSQRTALLSPLLKDSKKAIRVEAAKHLISLELAISNKPLFKTAFNELMIASDVSAWRGEGRVNLANIWLQDSQPDKAVVHLKKAIKYDPFFAPGYVNLADLYRAQSKEQVVAEVLKSGIENLPDSADINYSYGLHKVRQKQLPMAVELFAKSMQLDPSNPTMAYTYILAVDGLGQTSRALRELRGLVAQHKGRDQDLIELGLYLAQKAKSQPDFIWFQEQGP